MTLHIADLKGLVAESGLSPEQLSGSMQISPMTLRRLLKRPPSDTVPETYETLVHEGVYRLIIDGKLPASSTMAQKILSGGRLRSFDATIHALGFSETAMGQGTDMDDRIIIGLTQIGSNPERQQAVQEGQGIMARFEKLSKEWAAKIGTLRKALASRELTTFEKFAAYGALFYVIMPTDLIPDTIPVFGLVDDFTMVTIVAAYYLARFPALFV